MSAFSSRRKAPESGTVPQMVPSPSLKKKFHHEDGTLTKPWYIPSPEAAGTVSSVPSAFPVRVMKLMSMKYGVTVMLMELPNVSSAPAPVPSELLILIWTVPATPLSSPSWVTMLLSLIAVYWMKDASLSTVCSTTVLKSSVAENCIALTTKLSANWASGLLSVAFPRASQ